MHLNHVHVSVRELGEAVAWLERVWLLKPEFQNDRLATFACNDFILILDSGEADSPATIGFESDDCDRDFRAVVERGAQPIEPPGDRPWGVRCAYIQGPGQLKFEIEQPLNK